MLTLDPGAAVFNAEAKPAATSVLAETTAALDAATPSEPLPLAGIDVLLVEDFEDNQVLFGTLLRARGANVVIAANGRSGCDAAFRGNFDVILMDIQMPVLNGYEAIAELRARGYRRPVVALTAHAMKGEGDLCIEAGFDHYLTKPVPSGVLTRTVAAYRREASGPQRAGSLTIENQNKSIALTASMNSFMSTGFVM